MRVDTWGDRTGESKKTARGLRAARGLGARVGRAGDAGSLIIPVFFRANGRRGG